MTEAWIAFETAIGRGSGHLRLSDGKAWTLLTTLDELKGHEEGPGRSRPKGVAARRQPGTPTWLEDRRREARSSATTTQPYVVIIGGGQGGIALGARLRQLRRADDHRRAQRAPRRLVAQALQVAVPARPGLVRPPAVHQVPRELAGVLAEGQDRRLARDVHARDGAQLLGLDDRDQRALRRGRRRMDRDRRARRHRADAAAEAARDGDRHVRAARTCRSSPGMDRVHGRPAPLIAASRAGRVPRQARGRDRLEQLRARHLRGAVGARRRRNDGAAVLDAASSARTR